MGWPGFFIYPIFDDLVTGVTCQPLVFLINLFVGCVVPNFCKLEIFLFLFTNEGLVNFIFILQEMVTDIQVVCPSFCFENDHACGASHLSIIF